MRRRIPHLPGVVACIAGLLCFGSSLPAQPITTVASELLPTAALGTVQAVGTTDGRPPVYVATSSGLYRSASPTYRLWTRQNDLTDITALSSNPRNPQDLLYTRWSLHSDPNNGTYHSIDGGQTAQRVASCPYVFLARALQRPTLLYGGSAIINRCGETRPLGYAIDTLARSTDDGITWTAVYTFTNSYDESGHVGPIAINPADTASVLVANATERGSGFVVASADGGDTWQPLDILPLEYIQPTDIAIDPLVSSHVWTAWGGTYNGGLYQSRTAGKTWASVTIAGIPTTAVGVGTVIQRSAQVWLHVAVEGLGIDPLTGRLYVAVHATENPGRTGIYTIDAQGHVDQFGQSLTVIGNHLAVTHDGYIFSWFSSEDDGGYIPLIVRPTVGAGNWGISPVLSKTAGMMLRLLGHPISPTTMCGGNPCQYFDKGAVEEQGHDTYTYAVLVPRLIGAQVLLPVGGNTSTVTYQTLQVLHSHRTPQPAGFRRGTMQVHGGTFIPYSPTLAPASGYVVPPYFWRYMTDPRFAPGGWLHDIGLPLTRAVQATVSKGKLGTRHIMLQAFQDAILTYDPKNAAPFRVERANIGVDYAAAFPQAVR